MLPRIFVCSALSILTFACSIQNKRGDVGATGAPGTNGKDGLNGVAAVVYDTFDRTQACTNNGQMIFVSGDNSFYVCKDQNWSPFSIKGEQGARGNDGLASVVTDQIDLRAACPQAGQLIYDKSNRAFYACEKNSWQTLTIKGNDGKDGVAMVVVNDFDESKACEQNGNLVFEPNRKLFFYCSNSKWASLDLRGQAGLNGKDGVNGLNGKDGINGTNGKDGANGLNGKDGANGQTLFVENASQRPACDQTQFGKLYIIMDSGSVSACTAVDGILAWKTVYQAPSKAAQANQSLVDDCISATNDRRDFYDGMLGDQKLLTDTAPDYKTLCPKLGTLIANAESWKFTRFSNFFSFSGTSGCSTKPCSGASHLTDRLADILQYFTHIKNLSFESTRYAGEKPTFQLTSFDVMPVMPQLRSLYIPEFDSNFSPGQLDKFPELISLSMANGSLIGADGKSPLVHIENLSKLNHLTLGAYNGFILLTSQDLVEIAKLKNLRQLQMYGNPGDLSALANMDSLASLSFSHPGNDLSACPFVDKTRCR